MGDPSFAIPRPDQGGQQETLHSLWEVMDQTLPGTGGSCAAPVPKRRVKLLSGAAGDRRSATRGTGEVCSKRETASQGISTWCLLMTNPCGSPPWLRGNGARLHELRTSR